MTFKIDYGGLLISSPLDFYGLSRPDNDVSRDPDIEIRVTIGQLPSRRPALFDWQGRFGLVLEHRDATGWTIRYRDDIAIVSDPRGAVLDCVCRDDAAVDFLVEILSRRVLPRLMNLHGRIPVHAAAIANDSGAILLFGASGAGKSTLTAAAAATQRWKILSDDMSILDGCDEPHVWQTSPGVSVWSDSKAALGLPPESCRPIAGYDGKCWYAPAQRNTVAPLPVRALIFLSTGKADSMPTWQSLAGPQAMMLAASQMVPFDPRDVDASARALTSFNRLVSTTPCHILTYPRDYAALPGALDMLAAIQNDGYQAAL